MRKTPRKSRRRLAAAQAATMAYRRAAAETNSSEAWYNLAVSCLAHNCTRSPLDAAGHKLSCEAGAPPSSCALSTPLPGDDAPQAAGAAGAGGAAHGDAGWRADLGEARRLFGGAAANDRQRSRPMEVLALGASAALSVCEALGVEEPLELWMGVG
jgi:hypothetical protein